MGVDIKFWKLEVYRGDQGEIIVGLKNKRSVGEWTDICQVDSIKKLKINIITRGMIRKFIRCHSF